MQAHLTERLQQKWCGLKQGSLLWDTVVGSHALGVLFHSAHVRCSQGLSIPPQPPVRTLTGSRKQALNFSDFEQALTQVSLLTPKGGPGFIQPIFSHLILFPLPSSLSPSPSPVLFPPPLIPLLSTISSPFLLLFQDKFLLHSPDWNSLSIPG